MPESNLLTRQGRRLRLARVTLLVSLIVASNVMVGAPVDAAGPWVNYTDCTKRIDAFLTQTNPNVTQGYTLPLSPPPGGSPCYSVKTRAYADLFGTIYNASTFCQPAGVGLVQWTQGLYGNPWAVVSWWGTPGTAGDCTATVWYWE